MTAALQRVRLPAFVLEIVADRSAFGTLVAACAAIAAAGLDPHLLDPGMPSVRSALRAEPDLQGVLMLGAVLQAGALLVGEFVADTWRSERLVRLALLGLVAAAVMALAMPSGAGLVASRLLGWVCVGLILPFAIGAVAVVYRGAARATALGIAYAVLGAATATAPALALALGAQGPRWPAFLACAVMALVAFVVVRRLLVDLPGASPSNRPAIAAVATFAFGVVAVVSGLVGIGRPTDPLRIGILALGVAAITLSFLQRRWSAVRGLGIRVDLRPVAVALGVGIVVGFAQAAPMLQIPVFFQLIQGAPPLVSTIAIAPFVIALLAAGPVSGWLLARVSPRVLIASGVVAIGIADIGVAVVIGRGTHYLWFVVPLILIGAGFVIATTVRTAIIFASVPRQLPASAAALNEASIGVGSRVGVVVATVLVTSAALGAYEAQVAGQPDAARLLLAFRELLTVIGLPGFAPMIAGLDAATVATYQDAAVAGLRVSLLVPGLVAIVAGPVAYLLMGPRDPVRSVWELADERETAPADG